MDERTYALLDRIYDLLGQESFKIFDKQDFSDFSADKLDEQMEFLRINGYLIVKYAIGGEYCLGLTDAGAQVVRSVRTERAKRTAVQESQPVQESANAPSAPSEEPVVIALASSPRRQAAAELPARVSMRFLGKVYLASLLGALTAGGIIVWILWLAHVI